MADGEIIVPECKMQAGESQPEVNRKGKPTGWRISRFSCKKCPLYNGRDTGHDFIYDPRRDGGEVTVPKALASERHGCMGLQRREIVLARWRARQRNG